MKYDYDKAIWLSWVFSIIFQQLFISGSPK